MNVGQRPLLRNVWPEVARELEGDLRQAEETDLADSVDEITVFGCCGCGDSFCLSFYTEPPPRGAWAQEGTHETVVLERGLILDVVDGRIAYVEDISGDAPARATRKDAYRRVCDTVGSARK